MIGRGDQEVALKDLARHLRLGERVVGPIGAAL